MPEPAMCVWCRRQPVDPAWRPFCSRRCQRLDLAQWAGGAYRVPGEPQDGDKGEGKKAGEGEED